MVDSLLGIPDRGQYDADFPRLCGLAAAGSPLGLLVVDLDEFKMINDTYGHQAGDEVLKKVGSSVNSVVQGKGECYRYGGDEIAVLLPNRDIQAAAAIADEIRLGIERLKFEPCSERMTVKRYKGNCARNSCTIQIRHRACPQTALISFSSALRRLTMDSKLGG